MNFFISAITALLNIILGVVVLRKGPKNATNRLFAFLTFIIAAWASTNYVSVIVTEPSSAIVWIRIVMATVAMMFPVIFLVAHTFPNEAIQIRKPFFVLIIILMLGVSLLSISPLVFRDAVIQNGKIVPIAGPGIPIFGLNVIFYLLGTIIVLIKKKKEATGTLRSQINLILLGLSSTFIISFFTTFIFVVILKYTDFVIFGPVYSLFLIFATSYAIIKHRLFDLRLIVARSVSYSLLLIAIGFLYAGGFFLIGSLFAVGTNKTASLGVSTGLALIISFTFQPLRVFFEKVTDRVFYKNHYNSQSFLHSLSQAMAQTLTLSDLSYRVLDIITSEMRISKAYFAIYREQKFFISGSNPKEKLLQITKEEVQKFQSETTTIVFEDIAEGSTKDIMRKNEIAVILPLRTRDHYIGTLLLGEKSSGDIYFDNDINVLEILGPQLAIALENAQRFEEISQFNVTLQEEVKRATEDLRSANEKLKRLDQLKDEFISIASHDLRTPMATIRNYIWLAKESLNKTPKETKENLEIALESTQHAISLVGDMLDVSRIEAGRIELKPEKLNIADEIKLIVEELTQIAADKKVKISSEVAKTCFAKADKERIHQVLTNLAGNAIKFTPANGSVIISAKVSGEMVEVSVKDSGIGIKKEDIGKLFGKFSKLDSGANVPKSAGTGLGLYISKNIVELSGGKIWVESTPGKGSVFTFSLPAA